MRGTRLGDELVAAGAKLGAADVPGEVELVLSPCVVVPEATLERHPVPANEVADDEASAAGWDHH